MANFFLAVYHFTFRTISQNHMRCAISCTVCPSFSSPEHWFWAFLLFPVKLLWVIHHVIPLYCEDSGYENTGWIELYFSIRDDIRDWCRAYLQLVFRCDSLKCLCKSACSLIGCCADSTPTLHAVYSGCTSCLFQEVKGKEKTIVYQIWIPSTYRYQAHLYRNTNQGGFMAQHYS